MKTHLNIYPHFIALEQITEILPDRQTVAWDHPQIFPSRRSVIRLSLKEVPLDVIVFYKLRVG